MNELFMVLWAFVGGTLYGMGYKEFMKDSETNLITRVCFILLCLCWPITAPFGFIISFMLDRRKIL